MKYIAMIYGNQAKWESFPADAWPEAIARQDAFNKKYRDSGELLGADEPRRVAMRLVDESGFDPFDTGELADSWRQQPATPAYCTELSFDELGPAPQASDREKTPAIRDRQLEHIASLSATPALDDIVEHSRSFHR
ncbi:hypothetical protein ACIREO_35135 [Streptomyces sp. NPDC102441]|uniref:hypothetical protein n=1 Tax=Streptomyces sp. NPDC102441 TaxID=3366176 RepID=UPI0037F4CFAF